MTDTYTPDLSPYTVDSLWLERKPAARTLLVVYAHPDDESFGNAGTIARYSAAGVVVHYACATRGECGSVDPALLAPYHDRGLGQDESIATLRTAELACAAHELGLAGVHFLGYRDSGMPGAPDNRHPAALAQAPTERVAGQVAALIRALRPQVILTFGPYGGYGHPDHIAIHHATFAAFANAGDPSCYPEQIAAGLPPWSPRKLYYSTFGVRLLKASIPLMRLLRRDPRRFGENGDVDLQRAAAEATPITTAIDGSAFLEQKLRAWQCHHSQLGGMGQIQRLPAPLRRLFVGTEHFTRVVPAWDSARKRERDLFAGIVSGP
jgi:LmbE family N-acetylglucosaminyl deacetylase